MIALQAHLSRMILGSHAVAGVIPQYVWDFENGFRNAEFSVLRASPGFAQRADGTWFGASSNTARFAPSGALMLETASANLAPIASNPSTTAGTYIAGGTGGTISIVDDTAALAAAGLSEVTEGRALLLNNSAGTGPARLALQGTFVSTVDWVASAYLRATAAVTLRTGYGGFPAIGVLSGDLAVSPTSYRRVSRNRTQRSAGTAQPQDTIWFEVAAGGRLLLSCPQLETGRLIASSPMFRIGAGGTRAAETLLLSCPAQSTTVLLRKTDGWEGPAAVQGHSGGLLLSPPGGQIGWIGVI